MNEELQKAIAEIIESAGNGIKEGASFLSAELPDYIHQLLMWKMTESLIYCVIGLTILGAMAWAWVKFSGRGEEVSEDRFGRKKYKFTITHGDDGDVCPIVMVSAFVSIVGSITAIAFINLTWLQIMIAPKVYILEYASKMIN